MATSVKSIWKRTPRVNAAPHISHGPSLSATYVVTTADVGARHGSGPQHVLASSVSAAFLSAARSAAFFSRQRRFAMSAKDL